MTREGRVSKEKGKERRRERKIKGVRGGGRCGGSIENTCQGSAPRRGGSGAA